MTIAELIAILLAVENKERIVLMSTDIGYNYCRYLVNVWEALYQPHGGGGSNANLDKLVEEDTGGEPALILVSTSKHRYITYVN